jgi:hypothetical protein
MTKVFIHKDELYPFFFSYTQEDCEQEAEGYPTTKDFDKYAVEFSDNETRLIKDYWEIHKRYHALMKQKFWNKDHNLE